MDSEKPITQAQDDYRRGKMPHQAKAAIRAKETLRIIIANPGITSDEIAAKMEPEKPCLFLLQKHRLVRFENPKNEAGKRPCKWYAYNQ